MHYNKVGCITPREKSSQNIIWALFARNICSSVVAAWDTFLCMRHLSFVQKFCANIVSASLERMRDLFCLSTQRSARTEKKVVRSSHQFCKICRWDISKILLVGSIPAADHPDWDFPGFFLSHTRQMPGWYLQLSPWPTPSTPYPSPILAWTLDT